MCVEGHRQDVGASLCGRSLQTLGILGYLNDEKTRTVKISAWNGLPPSLLRKSGAKNPQQLVLQPQTKTNPTNQQMTRGDFSKDTEESFWEDLGRWGCHWHAGSEPSAFWHREASAVITSKFRVCFEFLVRLPPALCWRAAWQLRITEPLRKPVVWWRMIRREKRAPEEKDVIQEIWEETHKPPQNYH